MVNFKLFSLLLVLSLTACQPSTTAKIKKDKTMKAEVKPLQEDKTNDIWSSFPLRLTPLIDTTNFDYLTHGAKLSIEEVNILKLKGIYPEIQKEGYTYKFYPAYKLELSQYFHTIVLIVEKGDHEIDAVLVNYSEKDERISHKVIAYDEIAEGWSRKYSHIENNVITIIDAFSGDTKQIDTTKFHINKFGEINPIKTIFSSEIRPEQIIQLNKIYTDTIEFSSYNDDYDYFLLFGKKNGKVVSLIYNWEHSDSSSYHFNPGDFLKITWKMDSIYIAGDGETLDFSERVIDAVKL